MIRMSTFLSALAGATLRWADPVGATEHEAAAESAIPEIADDTEACDADALRSAHGDAVQQSVDAFVHAFESSDFETIVAGIPPEVVRAIATSFGTTPDVAAVGMVELLEQGMALVDVEDFHLDLAAADFCQTAAGRAYAVIPTTTTFFTDGRRIATTGTTLALVNDGTWHLIRMAVPQQFEFLQAAFPDFAGLKLPPGTSVLLE